MLLYFICYLNKDVFRLFNYVIFVSLSSNFFCYTHYNLSWIVFYLTQCMYVSMYVCMYVLGTCDLSVFMKKIGLYRACHFYYRKRAQYFSTINDEQNISGYSASLIITTNTVMCRSIQHGS